MAENLQPTSEPNASFGVESAAAPGAGTLGRKKEPKSVPLPLLVEFGFTASIIFLLLLDLLVVIILLLSGASLVDLVIRTSVTTLVMGSLLMLLSWQLATGVLHASQTKPAEPQPAESGESSPAIEAL